MTMNTMTDKIRLRSLRAELGIDQLTLAEEAHLHQSTISKMEKDQSVVDTTAFQVFYAINRLRKQRGYPELSFDDIEWHIK